MKVSIAYVVAALSLGAVASPTGDKQTLAKRLPTTGVKAYYYSKSCTADGKSGDGYTYGGLTSGDCVNVKPDVYSFGTGGSFGGDCGGSLYVFGQPGCKGSATRLTEQMDIWKCYGNEGRVVKSFRMVC